MPDTTFLLIRHGAHTLGHGIIAGRTPVPLSPLGQEQAARLVERLGRLPLRAIYCSPVQRTRETAAPLADHLGLEVRIRDSLSEIDYGDWTRKPLDELRREERWQQWCAFRSGSAVPGGERLLEVQARLVAEMQRLREEHPAEMIALVSHGDPIKSAVAYWLGIPLDLMQRLEISLASVSVVHLGDYGASVLCVNHTGEVALR